MSDLAIGASPTSEGAFRPSAMLAVLAVGILAFVAMLVLGAYAPDMRSGRNGGTHALSNGATGYSALVALARATGRNPQIVRNDYGFDSEELLVLTPETGATDLSEVLDMRATRATLIVLPKWYTSPDPKHGGWVRARGPRPPFDPESTLAPAHKLSIARTRTSRAPLKAALDHAPPELRFTAPLLLQTVSGKGLKPIVTDSEGRAVVAQVGDAPLYILADPDLFANHGLADLNQARSALALLDFLNSTDSKTILFDVTLNGFGRSRSPLKLAFDPPFLATTLAIAAVLLLVGGQAVFRFGPVRRPERALAFGKAALVDNAAALVRKAGREASLGALYADVARQRAAAAFAAPQRLRGSEIDDYLDGLGGRTRFSALTTAAAKARTREELLAAARALNQWQEEKTGER